MPSVLTNYILSLDLNVSLHIVLGLMYLYHIFMITSSITLTHQGLLYADKMW